MAPVIDNDFARFGSKSYAINKINSVEVRERRPHSEQAAFVLAGVGALILWLAFKAFQTPDGTAGAILAGMFGLLFGCLAYWQWKRSQIREYLLFLMTSSSETQAFVTRDYQEVGTLRSRIEEAMIRHSRAGTDR